MTGLRLFLTLTAALLPAWVYAGCSKGWEVTTLVATGSDHTLIGERSNSYSVSARWLRGLSDTRERIDQASGIHTRLIICSSEDANAFAWRAGETNMTGVTLGMVKLLGDDFNAIAALLGHENAHLVLNHGQLQSNRSFGLGVIQLLAGVALEVAFQRDMGIRGLGSDLSSLGNQAISAAYSRDAEREADSHGVGYASSAGFNPTGSLTLHRLLATSSNFLSTHPSSEDRIGRLQGKIAEIQALESVNLKEARSDGDLSKKTNHEMSVSIGRGQILSVNRRHGYFVATQTSLLKPQPGMKVFVGYAMERELSGTIQKVVDGYFSVLPDQMLAFYPEGKEFTFK
jgi:Zn-dependent protease with chaperone function